MRWFFHGLSLLAMMLTALLTVSCKEKGVKLPETGATLEGTITYGSDKLAYAMVIVRAEGSTAATGMIDDNGRYRVENVPLGEVLIGVNTSAARGQFQSKMMAQSQGKPKKMPPFIDVPEKYFHPETSGVKTTINKGPNTHNIVIPK
jgi:hypothetical protein